MTVRRYVRCRDIVSNVETDVLSTDKRIGTQFIPVNRPHWPDSTLPRPDKLVLRPGIKPKTQDQGD
jgi:hypothetical protein|nr:MAG TPA: hypothetical protein [Caudoviricetes sp.]